MKKYLTMVVAALAVAAVALPAYAFEVSWGGMFRTRIISDNYFTSSDSPNVPAYTAGSATSVPSWYGAYSASGGTYAIDQKTGAVKLSGGANTNGYKAGTSDHQNKIDDRARIYMYINASENLRVVTRFEVNNTWGDPGSGGTPGADATNQFRVKNVFVQFNIPQTPVQATVGIQGIALLNSWLIDNDFSAAVLKAKLDPVTVSMGYIASQNDDVSHQTTNIDSLYLNVDYANGPLSGTIVGFYQDGHDTAASIDPANDTQSGPNRDALTSTIGKVGGNSFLSVAGDSTALTAKNNNLFDLGINLNYKLDWMNAYLNFLKNFGSVDLYDGTTKYSKDYKGWMLDAGGNAFFGPYTVSLQGFYATGPSIDKTYGSAQYGQLKSGADADWFVQPYQATDVYTSELMGSGVLDNNYPYHENYQWTSTGGVPMNLWAISIGGAWQALPTTKLSASYWYFGNPNDVVSGYNASTGRLKFGNSVGNEFDFGVTQDIVDGLKLDLVAAYMISGDAYSMYNNDPNPYELGARIQWAF